jgi:hypothetical protein
MYSAQARYSLSSLFTMKQLFVTIAMVIVKMLTPTHLLSTGASSFSPLLGASGREGHP